MTMRRLISYVSVLFILVAFASAEEHVQLCRVVPDRNADFCMAVKSYPNSQAGHYDLYLTFSIKFANRQGWAAFGIGDVMDGALMFVMYPGKEVGDTTFSLRTTVGHLPPTPIEDQSMVEVIQMSVDDKGYNVVQAICRACTKWTSSIFDMTSAEQPWLYSTHYHQRTRTDDTAWRMVLHTDYGKEKLNMVKTMVSNGPPLHPRITSDRKSTGKNAPPAAKAFSVWELHGMLLATSALVMCAGVLLIRSGHKDSFRLHWAVQSLASFGVVAGCLLGLATSKHPIKGFNVASAHKIAGLGVLIGVPLQILFGYRHHVNYVKFGGRTKVSYWHIWLGRSIWIILNLNVFMGLQLAQQTTGIRILWGFLVLLEIVALATMWHFWRRREKAKDWQQCATTDSEESQGFIMSESRITGGDRT